MTFSKPLTGTFAFEGVIPSAAMNIINNAIPNALDKTGDNAGTSPAGGISGLIEVLGTGSLKFDNLSSLILESGSEIAITSGATIVNSGIIQSYSGGEYVGAAGSLMFIEAGANLNIASQTTSNGLTLGTGCIQSSLSFGSQVGPIFIEQVGQTAVNANGNSTSIIAQAGGAASTTTGGALVLQGGVGGATGGDVELVGGIGTSGIINGQVALQNNYLYSFHGGNNTGQTGQIYKQTFYCTTVGISTQTFVPYIFTLIGSLTFVAEITYTCKNVPIGGKAYSFGVAGSQTTGNSYGTAAGIVQVGSNLAVSITPPAGGDSQWQFDCYLQLN